MITVEELIVSSLYHRLVLVSVKRTPAAKPQPENQEDSGEQNGTEPEADTQTSGGDDSKQGLGFLFMGAMAPEVRKAFSGQPGGVVASDGSRSIKEEGEPGGETSEGTRALLKALGESGEEVQYSREVQTVLDTGEIQLMSAMMETQTQTDFPPVWHFGSGNHGDEEEGEGGAVLPQGETGLAMPPIDLTNCDGFSIVRLEDLRDPGKGSLVMVQTSKIKELMSNGAKALGEQGTGSRALGDQEGLPGEEGGEIQSVSQRGSGASEMLQISTGPSTESSPRVSPVPSPVMADNSTAVYVRPAEASPVRSQASSGDRGEIDSGIWDMIQGLDNKNNIREVTSDRNRKPPLGTAEFSEADIEGALGAGRGGNPSVSGAYRKYEVGAGGDAGQLCLPLTSEHSLNRGDSNETSSDTVVGISPNEDLCATSGATKGDIIVTKIPSRPPSRSVSPRLEEVEEAKRELYASQIRGGGRSPSQPAPPRPEDTPRRDSKTESSESNTSSPNSMKGKYRMYNLGERPRPRPRDPRYRPPLQQSSPISQGPEAEIKFVIQSSESEFSADTSTSSSVTELSPLKASPVKAAFTPDRMTQSLTYEHRSADGSRCTSESILLTDCTMDEQLMCELYEERPRPARRPHSTAGLNFLHQDMLESPQSASPRVTASGLNVMSDLQSPGSRGQGITSPVSRDGRMTGHVLYEDDLTPDREGSTPTLGSPDTAFPGQRSRQERTPRDPTPRTQTSAREAGIMFHADQQGKLAIASRREKRQSVELSSLESGHMYDSDLNLESLGDDMSVTDFDITAYDAPDFYKHPNWMKSLPVDKHSIPLTQLAIPGAHISLAIDKDMRLDMDFSKCNYEMADFLRKLPPLSVFNNFRSLMKKIWKAWMPKQMLSVYHQLEAGARFLDIRITKFRGAFYGEHGLYTKQFRVYLKEIRHFVNCHPQEVVILYFHSLKQLEKGDKRRLVTQLFQVFGARLARVTKMADLTLLSLWRHKKQVVVVFPEEELAALENHIFSQLVWPDSILYRTDARQQSVPELVDNLELKYVTDKPYLGTERLYLHQAVLSPDMTMVFGDFQYKSMRELHLAETSGALSSWVEGKHDLNVVLMDYVGIGDVASQVIRLNYPPKKETMV